MVTPEMLFRQDDPKQIDSVAGVVEESPHLTGVYFRGHFDKTWAIQPKIARLDKIYYAGEAITVANDPKLQESCLLHRFRRRSYEQRGRVLNDWETLFLARHHDLPVRLLDWTSNPLVAL